MPVDVHGALPPTPAVHDGTGVGHGVYSPCDGQELLYNSDWDRQSSSSIRVGRRAYLHTPYPLSLRLAALSDRVMSEDGQARGSVSLRHDPEVTAGLLLPDFGCAITEEVLV